MRKPGNVSLVAVLVGSLPILAACSSATSADEATGQTASALGGDPTLNLLGTYQNAGGAIEISAYDKGTKRLFSVNSTSSPPKIEVVDIANPAAPVSVGGLLQPTLGVPNSVTVHKGLVATAWEATNRQQNGRVVFYDASTLAELGSVEVGAVPDMVTFTKKGDKVLVANEAEPAENYVVDPEGSVTIIDVDEHHHHYSFSGTTVRFTDSTPLVNPESIRVFGGGGSFGPPSTRAQDFEPEYITVSDDGKTAWVTLQENNAIAVLDVKKKKFTKVVGLGLKDHSLPGNGLDASDRDNILGNIKTYPIKGMYMPDSIGHFKSRGRDYLIMANEGDAREWGSFVEEARIASLIPPKDANGNYVATPGKLRPDHPVITQNLFGNADLGRLNATTRGVPTDANGVIQDVWVFGGRSFTIRDASAGLVYDSGDQIEQLMSVYNPGFQNSDQTVPPAPDSRSDNKGPEPEGIAVAKICGTNYGFIGLERIGGALMYDLTNPAAPRFLQYVNNRNFAGTTAATGGDRGPEGLMVIAAKDSPTRKPILVISNEISGSASFYQVDGGCGCDHDDDDDDHDD